MKKVIFMILCVFAIAGITRAAETSAPTSSEYHQFFRADLRNKLSPEQYRDAILALFDGRNGLIILETKKIYPWNKLVDMAEKYRAFMSLQLGVQDKPLTDVEVIDIVKNSIFKPAPADLMTNYLIGRIPDEAPATGERKIDFTKSRNPDPNEMAIYYPESYGYPYPYGLTSCGNFPWYIGTETTDNIPEDEGYYKPRYASATGDINITIDNNSYSQGGGTPSNGFVVDDGYSGNNNGSQEIVSRYKPNAVDWINTGMNVVDGVYGIIQGERDWRLQNNYSNQGNWGNNNFRGNNCAPRGFWGNNQQNNCVRPQFPQRNCWKRNTGWGNNSGGNGGGNIRSYNTSNLNPPQNNWNSGGYTPPRFNNSSLNGVIGGNQGGSTRSFTGGRTKKWGGR